MRDVLMSRHGSSPRGVFGSTSYAFREVASSAAPRLRNDCSATIRWHRVVNKRACELARCGVSKTGIESRWSRKRKWHYVFFRRPGWSRLALEGVLGCDPRRVEGSL